MQKVLPTVLLALGVLLAVGGVLFKYILFPAIITSKVKQQVRLSPDSPTYAKWENIPIPIFMRIHIFNVTNPDEIEVGKQPIVEEIGPYVYEQKRRKVNVTIHEELDTIDYEQVIDYFFQPEMSNGSETDVITMLNLPLIGMTHKLRKESGFTRGAAVELMNEDFPDEPVFIKNLTVGQLLFEGYHVDFMKALSDIKGEVLLPNNTFGLYYGKNGTTKDTLTVYSGVIDNSKFGIIQKLNNATELPFWKEDEYCNMINGSDGALFPPFVTRDRRLDIFSPELCRSLYLEYESDTEIHGLTGYRFTLPKKVLEDPRLSEENRCFCTDPGNEELDNCPKRGGYQLESCRKGAPIVISLPHFLDGDDEYRENVEGLEPIREKHETVITLEPTTGVLLEAKKRIQVNFAVGKIKWFKKLKKMPTLVLPIAWVDESAALTVESAERIKSKLIKPQEIVGQGSWVVVGVGCVVLALGLVVFLLRVRGDGKRRREYKP